MRTAWIIATMMLLAAPMLQSLPAQGQTDSVAVAPWTEGPVADDGHPTVHPGIPFGEGRHMRVLLRVVVDEDLYGARDLPVTTSVDLSAALQDTAIAVPRPYPAATGGQLKGFELDLDSLVLVEVDASEAYAPIASASQGGRTPMLVFPGDFSSPEPFDARTNPVVTLQWVLAGTTEGDRHFFLYFDVVHHGEKTAHSPSAQEAGRIASAVGPGRGTRIYVPLHDDLGIPTVNDPRSVRITNLQGAAVSVDIFQYNRFGVPDPVAVAQGVQIPTGIGSAQNYRYGPDQTEGALLIVADGMVMVEASSSVTASGFGPGMSRAFVPSVDGGYVGTRFAETPTTGNMHWFVYCPDPTVPPGADGCVVRLNGQAPVTVPRSGYWDFTVAAGQPSQLSVDVGQVAVQRVPGGQPTSGQRGLTMWPPLDGPGTASLFMGHAVSEDDEHVDRLLMMARGGGADVTVRNLVGSREILADRLNLGSGLYTDTAGPGGWGTSWTREWRKSSDPTARPEHADGPTRLRVLAGQGLTVVNGFTGGSAPFSALIPLQSVDGGLTYDFVVPADQDGIPVGKLVLFSPFEGTNVVAVGRDPDGAGAAREVRRSALLKDQIVDDMITQAGSWTLRADRPVLVAWTKIGTDAMSGIAPAITDLIQVEVEAAQFAGYMFDVQPVEPFKTANTNSRVQFDVDIRNLAQTIQGDAIPDTVELSVQAPQGWPEAQVIPSTVELGPEGQDSVQVDIRVPSVQSSSGGATVTLRAESLGEPRLRVNTDLRINFKVDRDVLVTADGLVSEASKSVASGETAQYLVNVLNTGGTQDRFDVEYSQPSQDWMVTVTCLDGPAAGAPCLEEFHGTTPVLDPGGSTNYLFEVARTPGSTGVSRLVTQILATSHGDPSANGGIRLLTATETNRSFMVTVDDPTRVVAPGTSTTFDVVVTNEADVDEEVRVRVRDALPPEWTQPTIQVALPGTKAVVPLAALNNTFLVPASSSVHLYVEQPVPTGERPLALGLAHLSFSSTLDPTAGARGADLRVIAATVTGLQVSADPADQSVGPGDTATINVELRSTGNTNQTIRLEQEIVGSGTDWRVLDSAGQPGPWSVPLAPGETVTKTLRVEVPLDAQSAVVAPVDVKLRGITPGYPVLVTSSQLMVAPEPRIAAGDFVVKAVADALLEATVPVRNLGNIDVHIRTEWEGLGDGWAISGDTVDIPTGEERNLLFRLEAPADEEMAPSEATARLIDTGTGRSLLEKQWNIAPPETSLGIALGTPRILSPSQAVYPVTVTNDGGSAARDVDIVLARGDAQLDVVTLEVVLPGSQAVANLIGPRGADGMQVQVQAAGWPEAQSMEITDEEIVAGHDGKNVPGLVMPLVAAPLLLAYRRRRW